MTPRLRFFVGKGGVGKTTSSILYSLVLARRGFKVLVVSIDPAHNLGDLLGISLGEEPKRVEENLYALELDYDGLIDRYLSDIISRVKRLYSHLEVFNVEGLLDTLRYAPGVEESAVLEEIISLVKRAKDYDYVVFDPPPTGLTLRILAQLYTSLRWVERLIAMRRTILEKRSAISRILDRRRGEEHSMHEDPVIRELAVLRESYNWILDVLKTRARVLLVLTPEELPLIEAKRAHMFLGKLGIRVSGLIVNKVLIDQEVVPDIAERHKRLVERILEEFKGLPYTLLPYALEEPKGLEGLKALAKHLDTLVNAVEGVHDA